MDNKWTMEAILGPDFETFLSDLMEEGSEANSMLDMMEQNDLDDFALKIVNFLSNSHDDDFDYFKKAAFVVLGDLVGKIGETIVVPSAKNLHLLFRNTLYDDTIDLDLRISAMRAVITFIQRMPCSNEKECFQDLLAGIMKTLTYAYLSKYGFADGFPLKLLIELAKTEPRFLRTQLVDVVSTMFDIAEAESLEEGTRHLAVEFLLTLVEAKKRAPGMIKRVPLFISRCFAMLLKLLLDIKDVPAWHSAETYFDGSGTTSNYQFGSNCLDRFSLALGGKSIAHVAIEQLSAHSAAPEWEKRHAALVALAMIAEGCSKVMIKNSDPVVAMVLNCFQDDHPRVRWAACCALEQLLTDFRPHLQENYHNQVLLALAAAVDDFHPRVQAIAAEALRYTCYRCKPEYLIPHLDGLVDKLLVLIKSDKQFVQLQALGALMHIPFIVKEHFQTYYDTVMPHLKTIVRNKDLKSDLIILTRAMECISNVARAVGREKFRDDETQVMEMLMSLQAKVDDPATTIVMLHASYRLCECMGQDFLPYMNAFMPRLMQCVQLTTISIDNYDGSYELDANSKVTLGIKGSACDVLGWYAYSLKEDFYPWISQAVSILVPLMKFHTHRPVREKAVVAMHHLLRPAQLAVEKGVAQESYFTELSDHIIRALLEALHKVFLNISRQEPNREVCGVMLDRLDDCLQIRGPLLNEGQVRSIVDEIKHVITDSSRRKQELREREKMEDFDAEEAELLREESEQEEKVFKIVCYILRTLIRSFKASFLPSFDELSSYLLPMWAKEKTTTERCSSIRIFTRLMEECPEAALKYYDSCLPLILGASTDEDPGVRQNALYGLVLWIDHCPSSFEPFVGEALSRINVVIMHSRAREPENEDAYGYAVVALGRICQFHGESLDSAEVIPAWLTCLPIKGRLKRDEFIHELLCSMVERSDRELLGPNYENLPKVVSVFAEILCSGEDLSTEETANRMIDALRNLQQTVPPDTMESAWSYILPRQEMELKSLLSSEEDAYF